ncbi:hypothetical protein IFM89_033665 [Coptis chinensis]|uniref:Uncharacterized protein n=1 Tax=Coptis chinensis TaxID=261450 RepID=A0A835HJ37_9MAGN|nr:hypothetical protein IFM89_033665 [Coptis chinensis]
MASRSGVVWSSNLWKALKTPLSSSWNVRNMSLVAGSGGGNQISEHTAKWMQARHSCPPSVTAT